MGGKLVAAGRSLECKASPPGFVFVHDTPCPKQGAPIDNVGRQMRNAVGRIREMCLQRQQGRPHPYAHTLQIKAERVFPRRGLSLQTWFHDALRRLEQHEAQRKSETLRAWKDSLLENPKNVFKWIRKPSGPSTFNLFWGESPVTQSLDEAFCMIRDFWKSTWDRE